MQGGQIVMMDEVLKPLFGSNASLELRKQGGYRLKCVDRFRFPLLATEFDDADRAGDQFPRAQRSDDQGGRRRMAGFGDPPSIRRLHLMGRNHDRLLALFTHREYWVSTSEADNCERVGVWRVGSRWPLGDQHRGPEAVVIAAQEAGVRVELLDDLSQHLFAHLGSGGCRRLHQSLRNSGDEIARHGSLPMTWCVRLRLPSGRSIRRLSKG